MLKKNFHLCFSRIHCLPTSTSLTLDDDEQEQEREGDIVVKSFNSLYDLPTTPSTSTDADASFFSDDSQPDFSSVFSSHRFFVSTPGTSNSILDSDTRTVTTTTTTLVRGGIPVQISSPDPYVDFKASMEEMVRAWRELQNPTAENGSLSDEWEYLHELLLCYLSLNPKRAHKFIIGAFTDLLLSLVSS